ncbi:MAG: hypothetical protein ACYDCG_00640 [Candidatus Acidiferrales bacterium]
MPTRTALAGRQTGPLWLAAGATPSIRDTWPGAQLVKAGGAP